MNGKDICDFLEQPTDLTVDGQCSRCGGCCSSILPVTDRELAEMKAYADRAGFVPSIPGNPEDDTVYMMCPFLQPKTVLTTKRTCAVYDARPEICRSFICSNTNGRTQEEYMRQTGGHMPPKAVNVWKAYNLTGLRKNGKEIPYDQADVAQLEDDCGNKIQFQVGQPLNIMLESGGYMHAAMCIAIFNDGMQVARNGRIQFVAYNDIKSVSA